MTPEILQATKEMIAAHNVPTTGRLLEFGSYNVNGTQRVNFPEYEYIGVDIEAGPCVDIVGDVTDHVAIKHELEALELRSFWGYNVVVSCETLEHVPLFWKALQTISMFCRDGGHILLSFPTFGFPYHAFPVDCNRFTMDAVNGWAKEFNWQILEHREVKDAFGNPCLVILFKQS